MIKQSPSQQFSYAQRLHELTNDVEDLLAKLADDKTPQIQELRNRIKRAVQSARTAIAERRATASEALKNAAVSADDLVHQSPWIAIGVTAVFAGAVGFLAGLGATSKKRRWG